MDNPGYSNHIDVKHPSSVPWSVSDVIFVYFCIFILSIIFTGSLLYANIDIDKNFYIVALQILLSVSILTLIYLIVVQKYNIPFKEAFGISFNRMPRFIHQGIIVTAIMIVSTTVIGIVFSEITNNEPQTPYTDMSLDKFKWLSLLAVFFAPVVEEFFFRGFMQPAIIKRLGVIGGIVVTALIFGISHTQYLNYGAALFSVTAIGLILGIARYKTGSVMPGIFAHFFNNFLAVLFIFN